MLVKHGKKHEYQYLNYIPHFALLLGCCTLTETWTKNLDETAAIVTGRQLKPWTKKINPLWWFGNDDEPTPPEWYMPGSQQWLRVLAWYARNPLENFSNYVIGVSDRNLSVVGMAPIMVVAWNDLPGGRRGFKWSVIHLGWLRLPFISYVGKYIMWYAGWEYGGFFGFKWNILNSSIQAY